ncbi:hypothetical protein RBB50_011489 [Rhinocladiella similis]
MWHIHTDNRVHPIQSATGRLYRKDNRTKKHSEIAAPSDYITMTATDKVDMEEKVFTAIPWCRKLLDDPDFTLEPTGSRLSQPQSNLNTFPSRTLKTPDTIAGWCSLFRRPETSPRNAKDELRTLLALQQGLNGYIRVCHGGATATMFDEIMSILVFECRKSQRLDPNNVTADLRIKYVKPVPTDAVVLVTAKIVDIQKGKKYFVKADMVDERNVVLSTAEALFIHIPMERL